MDATQPVKRQSEELESEPELEEQRSARPTWQAWNLWGPVVVLSVATLASYALVSLPDAYTSQNYSNIALIYLMAAVFSAVSWGIGQSLVTALVGFVLYQFYFRKPSSALELAPHDFIGLALFVAASMIAAIIGSRSKQKLEKNRERKRTIAAFSKLYEELLLSNDEEKIMQLLSEKLSDITHNKVYVFLPDERGELSAYYPKDNCPESYIERAQQSFHLQEPSKPEKRKGTAPFFYCMPMPSRLEECMLGVLGLEIKEWNSLTSSTAYMHSLSDQAALAFDRARLSRTLNSERNKKEQEALRSALLASVTHDLKTPLASVIGSLSSLRHMDALDENSRQKLLITAHEEAKRLDNFISNILHMTKLESGSIKLDKGWDSPVAIVHRVTKRLRDRLQHHPLDLQASDQNLQIHLDTMLVEQAIQNLLDNAVKYGAPASPIRVEIRMNENGKGVLSVSNEGTSIPKSNQRKIFDKFYRASKGDKITAGTGLGLAICQAIMDIHKGSITVSEATPGAEQPGAVFTLTFPEARIKHAQEVA